MNDPIAMWTWTCPFCGDVWDCYFAPTGEPAWCHCGEWTETPNVVRKPLDTQPIRI